MPVRNAGVAPKDASKGAHFFRSIQETVSCVIDDGNGAATEAFFGRVRAGTPVAKKSTGLYRPAGFNTIEAASSGTSVTLNESRGIFVGDEIFVYAGADALGSVTIADADGAASDNDLVFTGVKHDGLAHKVVLVDPGSNAADIVAAKSYDAAGVLTLTLTLGYSSADVDSTLTEIADAVTANGDGLIAGSVTGVGTGAADGSTVFATGAGVTHTLAGARKKNTKRNASSIEVTAINRTTDVLTLATAQAVAVDDYIINADVDDYLDTVAVLDETADTYLGRDADDNPLHGQAAGLAVYAGTFDTSQLTNIAHDALVHFSQNRLAKYAPGAP